MKNKYIKFSNFNDLTLFLLKAKEVKGDILVYRGKFCVDGKSLIGMIFINAFEGCKVEYPKYAIKFEEYLSKLEI